MNNKMRWSALFLVILGMIAGLTISAKLELNPKATSDELDVEATTPPVETTDFTVATEKVAQAVGPAVVSIHTERTEHSNFRREYYGGSPFGGSPFGGDDLFEKFFEDFFGGIPEQEFKQQGLGSGVIIDKEGYILTNEHVIRDADKITVTLADGREFKGTKTGTDPRSDLAVLKIDGANLPAARLRSSDNLKIGQWDGANGNSFGNI